MVTSVWRIRPLTVTHSLTLLVLAAVLARSALAVMVPLTEDEVYYQLWAQHLQTGYFDHPPMIAWWIRIGTMIAGDNRFGVRLLPIMSTALTSLVIYQLIVELGAVRATALRGACWFQATFLVAFAGMLATPDSPTVLFWALTLMLTARAVRTGRLVSWILAGATVGLALLSKYSALFLPLGMVIWAAADRSRRSLFARPGPWLAAAVASLIFSVNIAWNAQHDWMTFAKQFGRAVPDDWQPIEVLAFVFFQLVLLNPLIAWFAGRELSHQLRGDPPADHSDRSLLIFTTVPFIIYLCLHALHSQVQAHWTAPLFPAFASLAALSASTDARLTSKLQRRLAALVVPTAIVLTGVLAVLVARPQLVGAIPALGLQAWPSFARNVQSVAEAEGASWVGTINYGTNAQLSLAGQLHLPVMQLYQRERYVGWHDAADVPVSEPGLIVDLRRRVHSSDLELCFAHVTRIPDIRRPAGASDGVVYAAFIVETPLRPFQEIGCWDDVLPSSEDGHTGGASLEN